MVEVKISFRQMRLDAAITCGERNEKVWQHRVQQMIIYLSITILEGGSQMIRVMSVAFLKNDLITVFDSSYR